MATSSAAPLATPRQTVLDDRFVDDANGWGEFDAEEGSNFFDDGRYVTEFRGGPFLHWLPDVLAKAWEGGSLDLADVVVSAKLAISRGAGVAGVFCRESEDTDAEYTWYEFVVRDGYAAIRRADLRGNLAVLAETQDLVLPPGVPFRLEVTCVGPQDAKLSLAINHHEILRATDDEGALQDGLVGIQIWEAPDSLGARPTRVEWYSFTVATP